MDTFQLCIIDDQADYRFLLQQVFRRFLPAHSVLFFSGGNVFLHHLGKTSRLPDLVLVDRQMPGLSGYDVIRFMKTHQFYKHIPIVMVSAGASLEEIMLCYQTGANSFLTKAADLDSMKNQMIALCQYWSETSARPSTTEHPLDGV